MITESNVVVVTGLSIGDYPPFFSRGFLHIDCTYNLSPVSGVSPIARQKNDGTCSRPGEGEIARRRSSRSQTAGRAPAPSDLRTAAGRPRARTSKCRCSAATTGRREAAAAGGSAATAGTLARVVLVCTGIRISVPRSLLCVISFFHIVSFPSDACRPPPATSRTDGSNDPGQCCER